MSNKDQAASTAILLLLTTPSPVRHAFYEAFLHLHFVLAGTFLGAIWVHMDGYANHRALLKVAIALWALDVP